MDKRQAAADEFALQLRKFADELAGSGRRPRRVRFGRGRVRGLARHRSPLGFVVEGAAVQLLLPDGRLWAADSRLNPEGAYYDPRVDHVRSAHGSLPFGDDSFNFLGAVIKTYNFGYRQSPEGFEVGALVADGPGRIRFVDTSQALAEIFYGLP